MTDRRDIGGVTTDPTVPPTGTAAPSEAPFVDILFRQIYALQYQAGAVRNLARQLAEASQFVTPLDNLDAAIQALSQVLPLPDVMDPTGNTTPVHGGGLFTPP